MINKAIDITRYKTIRCGNEYGGFEVFEKNLLGKKIIVYSFGIGEDLSFSEDILKHFVGVEIYAFDPTPKAVNYVKNSALYSRTEFHFYDYALTDGDGEDVFFLPQNENYVSGSLYQAKHLKSNGIKVQKKKLRTIMNELGHNKIDLLKMDIEGSEFDVIDNLIDERIEFAQLCIEVHDRFFKDGDIKLKHMLKKLKNAGFNLINMSDDLQEFTFVKV